MSIKFYYFYYFGGKQEKNTFLEKKDTLKEFKKHENRKKTDDVRIKKTLEGRRC